MGTAYAYLSCYTIRISFLGVLYKLKKKIISYVAIMPVLRDDFNDFPQFLHADFGVGSQIRPVRLVVVCGISI